MKPSSISKLGQRRQVVIPKAICDELGLGEGDFVEVTSRKGMVLLKPKKLVDRDEILTPSEEAIVRKGVEQIRRGEYVTLDELENELDRQTLKRRKKSA